MPELDSRDRSTIGLSCRRRRSTADAPGVDVGDLRRVSSSTGLDRCDDHRDRVQRHDVLHGVETVGPGRLISSLIAREALASGMVS